MIHGSNPKRARLRVTFQDDVADFDSKVLTALRVCMDEMAPVEFEHNGCLHALDHYRVVELVAGLLNSGHANLIWLVSPDK